jgi:hypothetical protein
MDFAPTVDGPHGDGVAERQIDATQFNVLVLGQ